MVDLEYPGRVLIAEANQWPSEVAEYFGTAEEPECHMAFDFPVMPRIFYSLRSQSAAELKRVLAETQDVPEGAAWGIFLRNHDELTLEMVSEEYRQAMYGWYAYDPRMRSNIGIRRRLAPLLDNSRAEQELAHALLFSLAGSPFLYYGDEIGMGDNIWLPDRDASRTPMQWTPDRNAGFSTADPGKLYLPVVQSLVYNYSLVNVESQLAQSRSLLHWVRNVIHVRKAHPTFGLGSIRVLETEPRVGAGVRPRVRGVGKPVRRRAGTHPVRVLVLPQPGRVDDRPGRPRRSGASTTCSAAASSRRSTPTASYPHARRRRASTGCTSARRGTSPHISDTSRTCRVHGISWSA